ncbi:MAG: hypothetical protein QOI98_618, partial [Solirubrobacteraceae bacterium]|nr:hypothetical protein [Solirubrobacteraceae bacterium]
MTAVSLGLVAFALPAHADPGGVHSSATPSAPGAIPPVGEAPRTVGDPLDLRIEAGHAFYKGPRPARLSIVLGGTKPMHVTVEAVRNRDPVAAARWDLGVVAPGTAQEVEWNGTMDGRVQPEGTYSFRAEAVQEGAAPGSAPATVQG